MELDQLNRYLNLMMVIFAFFSLKTSNGKLALFFAELLFFFFNLIISTTQTYSDLQGFYLFLYPISLLASILNLHISARFIFYIVVAR